jgi:hypothetical protein
VNIDLEFQANRAEAAKKYADENGLVLLGQSEVERQAVALANLTTDFDKKVEEEVSRATQQSSIKHSYELKATKQEYETKEAGNLARITSLEEQLTAARQTITDLRADIDKNRQAEVERAKAGSIQNLNVGGQQAR